MIRGHQYSKFLGGKPHINVSEIGKYLVIPLKIIFLVFFSRKKFRNMLLTCWHPGIRAMWIYNRFLHLEIHTSFFCILKMSLVHVIYNWFMQSFREHMPTWGCILETFLSSLLPVTSPHPHFCCPPLSRGLNSLQRPRGE